MKPAAASQQKRTREEDAEDISGFMFFLATKKKNKEVSLLSLSAEEQDLFLKGSDVDEWKSLLDNKAVEVVAPPCRVRPGT